MVPFTLDDQNVFCAHHSNSDTAVSVVAILPIKVSRAWLTVFETLSCPTLWRHICRKWGEFLCHWLQPPILIESDQSVVSHIIFVCCVLPIVVGPLSLYTIEYSFHVLVIEPHALTISVKLVCTNLTSPFQKGLTYQDSQIGSFAWMSAEFCCTL